MNEKQIIYKVTDVTENQSLDNEDRDWREKV